ncbi:MAG: AAA family ATPase, partial [Anaerolineae bacterium]|nr:AAA family ATPase [Anaerolineae bacterium]
HRIIVGPNARIKDISATSIIHNILNTVPVPGATVGARF